MAWEILIQTMTEVLLETNRDELTPVSRQAGDNTIKYVACKNLHELWKSSITLV